MKKPPFLACVLLSLTTGASLSYGQTPQELRRAFQDMRSDNIPRNCERAVARLYPNRERLKDALLEELYKTDRQGRDAIMHLLFITATFVPDERFCRFVVARLLEQDTYVGRGDIGVPEGNGKPLSEVRYLGAHWVAWKFIDEHFAAFEPLLDAEISRTSDAWMLWGYVWLMKKRGLLEGKAGLLTPAVMARVAANLRDDEKGYNASQAVRIFLLLGDRSLPTLREAARSPDPQTASLARATMDALNGNHDAFGFLNSKLYALARTLFGDGPGEPKWLDEVTRRYGGRESYP